jgi:hypothetical protein
MMSETAGFKLKMFKYYFAKLIRQSDLFLVKKNGKTNTGGGPISTKVFCENFFAILGTFGYIGTFGDIGTFGEMGTEIISFV